MTDTDAAAAPAPGPAPSKNAGSQTLDRGIRALELVAATPGGMTVRELAEELESTLVLLVREGEEVVGIAVAAPTKGTYHLAFRTGSRHPLGRGSAGICLLSALPARPGERPEVTRARTQGFAVSKGEVEPGAHGMAVLIRQGDGVPHACLNLITYRDDIMAGAAPAMLDGAARISALLS
jgi:DNA-binding IclR family transcriptional regulator